MLHRRSLLWPGLLLGLGVGGFFDGIVFHQILQWHHLVSEVVPPDTVDDLRMNTLADGIFHAATWVFTVSGLVYLYFSRAALPKPGSGRMLTGAILAGWGTFNLVEGIINHHILELHHVRPGENQLYYDIGFLVWGALMLGGGLVLYRLGDRHRRRNSLEMDLEPAQSDAAAS